MPLHHSTKKSAVGKYAGLSDDELPGALGKDVNNYAPEEIEEIIAAIKKVPDSEIKGPKAETNGSSAMNLTKETVATVSKDDIRVQKKPNQKIAEQLAAFDYTKLTGEAFKKYCLFVQSLHLDGFFDFELYQVEVIKRDRYRGVKDTPVDTVGFKIRNSTPLHTTRIPVKFVLQNNGRVAPFRDEQGNEEETGFETIGCQLDHNGTNGRYYLLKK